MVVRLHPEAIAEYVEAISLYEDRATGLGREFFDEVQRVLGIVRDSPGSGSSFSPPYRRILCGRSPFAVVYREDGQGVRVQAVMHLPRQPGY
jgi:hypothetical protein